MRIVLAGRIGVVVLLLFVRAASPHAQTNPLVGTWRLNITESRSLMGAPSTLQVNTITAADPDGIAYVTERSDSEGQVRRAGFTAQFDGKVYPYRPVQDWRDGVRINRIDANTYEIHWKKGLETTGINYWVVSQDGRRLTWVSTGVENSNKIYNRIAVFDRQ